jgi:hypothetical protein
MNRLDALLADIEVDAGSRELASLLYHATLAAGRTEDEALDEAAAALRKMRADWADAKREDGDD